MGFFFDGEGAVGVIKWECYHLSTVVTAFVAIPDIAWRSRHRGAGVRVGAGLNAGLSKSPLPPPLPAVVLGAGMAETLLP